MGEHVHDPRQRYSYELRPDRQLDAQVRLVAGRLEAAGLLADGSATAQRFHPHLTFMRADRVDADALEQVAGRFHGNAKVELVTAGTFGDGRIIWLAPADDTILRDARAELAATLGDDAIDPQALARDPWTPHVTVAYEIAEEHRTAALELVQAQLPLIGRWRVSQAWDLDVRPTLRLGESNINR